MDRTRPGGAVRAHWQSTGTMGFRYTLVREAFMGAKGSGGDGNSGDNGKKTAGENEADEKRAGETEGKAADEADGQGADEEGPAGEPDPEEGVHPDQISAFLEQLARPPDAEPGEWTWPAVGSSIVGRFDLLRELGRGGFGVVYEAFDRKLHRVVALKVIRPGSRADTEKRREALQREALAAAQLSHPNIVMLFDQGTSEHGPFLVMEMLYGDTLQSRVARGALPVSEAVAVAVDVARAIAHAHDQEVLHRDLKPSNVFVAEDGSVKVLDFGLANILGSSGMRGGGTLSYMAPEQWRREPEDARTDVFGLGVVLFEILTGRLPYRVSGDRSEALDPGPTPPLALPGAPPALSSLVERALAKDPAERPRDGRAMLDALVGIQRSLPGGEAGSGRATAGARGPTRFWNAVAIVIVVALAAVVARWFFGGPPVEPPHIPVVVADVSNETGDPRFDNLSGLLIVSLQQSEILVPLTRHQMLDIARRIGAGEASRIDEALGLRIAREARAKALLLATLRQLDDDYIMDMRVVDPSSGGYLLPGVKEQGSGKPSVFGIIDRISDRVRRGMSERAEALRRSVIKVDEAVTRSLEAFQHYFRSQECMYRPSFGQDCAGELRQALAIDPTFALAYYQLAVWEERHGGARATEVAATEAAVRYLGRAPPKEQALIRAWKAHSDGNDDESLAVLKKLIEKQPRDPEAVWEAGDLLYHRSDFAGAVPFFERLLALEPAHGWGLDHLVHALGALRRTEDLRKRVAGWAAAPHGPTVFHAISAAQTWLGDYPAAMAAARREAEVGGGLSASEDLLFTGIAAGDYRGVEAQLAALEGPAPAIGYYALAALDGYQGRRRQGLGRFDAMVRDLGEEAADSIYHSVRAHYLAGGGRPGPVWDEVRELRAIDPVAAAAHAVTLAYLGDLDHAAEVAVNLRPGTPRRETYDAVVLWQRGQRSEALRRLREIAARSPFDADFALAPAYLLGDLAAQSGADAEAVKALHDFRSLFLPIMMWRSWAYPRSLVLSAASLERLGRRAEALELVDRLLADWRDADPGLPLLEEARALRARLASARAQTRPPVP